jgi:hypothetical protein
MGLRVCEECGARFEVIFPGGEVCLGCAGRLEDAFGRTDGPGTTWPENPDSQDVQDLMDSMGYDGEW